MTAETWGSWEWSEWEKEDNIFNLCMIEHFFKHCDGESLWGLFNALHYQKRYLLWRWLCIFLWKVKHNFCFFMVFFNENMLT